MKSKTRRRLEIIYHKIVIAVFSLLGLLPKKNIFFFESFHGKQYSDNPRAIYEFLRENHPEIKCVWAVKKGFEKPFIEENVPYVRRMGLHWLLTMPRAKYWIFNTRMPRWMVKTKGTTFVETWHGTPLKHLGLDIKHVNMPETDTKRYRENFAKETSRWDYLISPNAYSTEIFRRAFAYSGKILEIGYPRNDILQNPTKEKIIKILKKLHLKKENKIILYAPTWRDNQFHQKGAYKFENKFPYSDVLKQDSDIVILLRTHYLVVDSIDINQYQGRVIDVSNYPDISELYLISDLLITDYSSVMFDYAFLKRPMIFYMYDKKEYDENIRGFYFDPQEELPGPIVSNEKEVIQEIKKLLLADEKNIFNNKYQNFYRKFCFGFEGNSSQRLINNLLKVNSFK